MEDCLLWPGLSAMALFGVSRGMTYWPVAGSAEDKPLRGVLW